MAEINKINLNNNLYDITVDPTKQTVGSQTLQTSIDKIHGLIHETSSDIVGTASSGYVHFMTISFPSSTKYGNSPILLTICRRSCIPSFNIILFNNFGSSDKIAITKFYYLGDDCLRIYQTTTNSKEFYLYGVVGQTYEQISACQ